MKFFLPTILFPALAVAAPSLLPRQSSITISSVSATGPGCPAGSYSTTISGGVVTLGLDAYQTNVGPGFPGSDREKYCDITVNFLYPLGCTAASIQSTYQGFAQLGTGITGTFTSTYSVSPGQIGPNPPSTTFTSANWGSGGVYTRSDTSATTVRANSANQRNVQFMSRNRIILQSGQASSQGTLTADIITIAVQSQNVC
jgi:hypothetical protein